MNKNKIKSAIAISGVISGMVMIKPITAEAFENNEHSAIDPGMENVKVRSSNKGQVANVDGTYLRIRSNPSHLSHSNLF